jgi:hypothetical protein
LLVVALCTGIGFGVLESQEVSSATLYGQILENPGDRPIEGARVTLSPGDLTAVTGANGRFVLRNIPFGRYVIRFESLGYVARTDTMAVGPGQPVDVTVRLATAPLPLEPIEVVVLSEALQLAGFYERRDLGPQGTFFTERDIERFAPARLSDVVRRAPSALLVELGPGRTLLRFNRQVGMRSQIPGCEPAVFIDGILVRDQVEEPKLLDFNRVDPSAVAAIEVYVGSNTPLQFRQTACGAVVIWTKRGG